MARTERKTLSRLQSYLAALGLIAVQATQIGCNLMLDTGLEFQPADAGTISCEEAQCVNGASCENNRCVSNECFGIRCSEGLGCLNRQCVSINCGTTACPNGFVCDNETSSCVDSACFQKSCPRSTSCSLGFCVAPAPSECLQEGICDPNSGECSFAFQPIGMQCTDDGEKCTDDACDGAGQCRHSPIADGVTCGETTYSDWGSCAAQNTCDTTGTQARTVRQFQCSGGACQPKESLEHASCQLSTDGLSCGECKRCSGGSCSQNLTDGTPCAGGTCCGGECVSLSTSSNCGTCGARCTGSSQCIAIGNGHYACSCSANSECKSGYGSSATCWNTTGSTLVCNCQCGCEPCTCQGQCANNGVCHMISGVNYCEY